MFTPLQIILMVVFYALVQWNSGGLQIATYGYVTLICFVTGLIMGDVTTGLYVGGTLTLMSLGIGQWGGSSVPDYNLGCIIGTAFAIASGQGLEIGLAIGIPVASLGVQLNVFSKGIGSFFIHKVMESAEKKQWKKMNLYFVTSLCTLLLSIIPMIIVFTIGSDVIDFILVQMEKVPWLLTGFNVAGGLLPAMGFVILIKYLPVKEYGILLVLGFALGAYLNMPMLGTAMIGSVVAFFIYKHLNEKTSESNVASTQGGNYDE